MPKLSNLCVIALAIVATYCLFSVTLSPTLQIAKEAGKLGRLPSLAPQVSVRDNAHSPKPLCQLGEEYTKGIWVRNESIREYPYLGGDDPVWGPRCTELEHHYLAKGTVPDFLKYRWQPEACDLAPFDRKSVCQRLNGTIIGVIGDSMQQQFAHSFAGLMLGHLPDEARMRKDFGNLRVDDLCPDDSPYSVSLVFRRWNRYSGTREDRQALTEIAQLSDYLVINWGVHYQPWNDMENATQDFIRVLEEQWQPPHKIPKRLFWRSTIVAHHNCSASTGPLESAEHALHQNPNYNTNEIMMQDTHIVQPMLQSSSRLDVSFLRIEKSTILRSDGHRVVGNQKSEDCLHYCEPGPTDSWVELFYHHVVMGI